MDHSQDKRSTQFDMLQGQELFPENTIEQNRRAQKPPKRQKSPAAEQGRARKVFKSSTKPLVLPSIAESGGLGPVMQKGSIWEKYIPIFTCDLAGTVSISEHRRQGSKLVAIRASTKSEGEEMLTKYTCLHHINIISASECFKDDKMYHFVVEDLPVSLEHLVACDAYPTEVQLASILKQIMNGLSYLLECGYQHPSLGCSTTLMSLDGVVKIANLELIVPFTPQQSQSSSVKHLGFLAMELMQKYVKENVGIDDTTRWPIDSKAFDFLSSTTSAKSVIELSQHPLLAASSSIGSLIGLARLAIVSACTFYSYKG